MTTYTNITKPSGTSYTNLNPVGKQQYDDSNLAYDDSSSFYDGTDADLYTKSQHTFKGLWNPWVFPWLLDLPWQINATSYTNVTKPT